jgi:Caspase domain
VRKAGAVVIGVDKTGGLDPLKSAAAGAKQVAAWLAGEALDVVCLTDGPTIAVTSQDVSKAIARFATKPPTYDFLVVYFSGHGQWHTRADHWLLSGAPENTSEAVNLEGAMYTARRSGIPNVVFISDACRTIPKADTDSLVNGVDAFPNHGIPSISKVDYFKATSESRPAYEIPIGGMPRSVLTYAILSAFVDPEPQIVAEIVDGVETFSVIPNRQLESVLQTRVDAILDGVQGSPTQDLDTNVPSADTVYIARVRPKPPVPPAPLRLPKAPVGVDVTGEFHARRRPQREIPGRLVANAVDDNLDGGPFTAGLPRVNPDDIATRTPDPTVDHFETQTGFIVRGARVANAAISPYADSSVLVLNRTNDPPSDAVRINPGVSALPVVVELQDGRCAVLAALRGYLGHAYFDEEGLANVSYVPSSNSARWSAYNARRKDIDELRSLVALAVDHNTFRVRSKRQADRLADRIRIEKAADPTLGLYAAYAFAQAGLDDQVREVGMYMREDLGADLFDVRMLAGNAGRLRADDRIQAPFCPMLTQGWNLLRAYGVELPSALNDASRFLANSLWSTFTRRGAAIVFAAVQAGELQ